MRVLHLVKTTTGAVWALRQIRELRRLGVDVTVALPSDRDGLAPRYAEAGADVIAADLDFTARDCWRLGPAIARCRSLVARVRPDLIHSHFVSTTIVARLALGRHHPVPRLFQVPGPLHLEHALFRALDLATSGPADRWVATCRWTEARYRAAGVAPGRVALAYYGTDLEQFAAAPRGVLRAALGLGHDTPLVGMVAWVYPPRWTAGRLRGVKGHEDFIDAFARLRALWPRARAVVVGGAWAGAAAYERRLVARARRVCGDALQFTGPRDDVPAVYADLDLAVHPSLSENCGGAVESLAAGCPTIATAVGGLPDVVIPDRTGWLVPPRDPGALASVMLAALTDRAEARRRAVAGREHVRGLFAAARSAREIAALYRRILEGGGGAPQARPAGGVRRAPTEEPACV